MARWPRLNQVLIRAMWRLVTTMRAVWDGVWRVRVLPIGVQRWDNGITFGILVVYYLRRSNVRENGKEN